VINPNPKVVKHMIIKPMIIEFLAPILFLMQELKGAKIIEAIEKTEIMIETSVSVTAEQSSS
jgi:hypothetical protein